METDSPYLAPVPNRGKTCLPEMVRDTAEFLAELRGEDQDAFFEQTTQNAIRLFGPKLNSALS